MFFVPISHAFGSKVRVLFDVLEQSEIEYLVFIDVLLVFSKSANTKINDAYACWKQIEGADLGFLEGGSYV